MLRYALSAILSTAICCGLPARATVKESAWGKMSNGAPVKLYTLHSANLLVQLTEYGARVVKIEAPDRWHKQAQIVLGYDNLSQYVQDPKTYFGSIVGRYGNRIANGQFTLEGSHFQIPPNDHGNALHGGLEGFSNKLWRGRIVAPNSVEFTLISPDGDMGFPGTLTVHVVYRLSSDRLDIYYSATTTKATVVNLTNHSYFNLAGESSGDILAEELRIDGNNITPVDAKLIPTGELLRVKGTPFDFSSLTPIGQRIGSDDKQMQIAGGYDHNFLLSGKTGTLHEAAFVDDPGSGRTLTVFTTEPGLQFYSGNFLDGTLRGASGNLYVKHAGFCLETQHFPDSPNHPNFPSTELKSGNEYRSETVFVFGIEENKARNR